MAEFGDLGRRAHLSSALPPLSSTFKLASTDSGIGQAPAPELNEPHPISGLVCVIDYGGDTRLITCRRFDGIGEFNYVGAICHSASGYRQFRCDRIRNVYDASTGEMIGDGSYFARFSLDSYRERAPTWGLAAGRKATLVAGLNVLAFMARCDGHWHPLETEIVEKFVCTMWLRKEWEGEPPLDEIVVHAQRLSPDADIFFRSLSHYAGSSSSARILCRAVGDLIAADGVICDSETRWGAEIDAFFRDYSEDEFDRLFGSDRETTTADIRAG